MRTKVTLLLITMVWLAGCGHAVQHYTTSAVDYLYPDKERFVERTGLPHLELPIKVGIAFVPDSQVAARSRQGGFWEGGGARLAGAVLTEADRAALLEKVGQRFESFDFIDKIEIIPSAYLVPQGSFSNLDQIRTMYDIDVIALVSYDQTQFTDEGVASITYWTLVGAYVVPGEKNATHTMVDVAVYDIRSRTMLFRAPGVSRVKSTATPVNLSAQLRKDRGVAFEQAADDLIANLEEQLNHFRASIEKQPEKVTITRRAGYSGGGYTGWIAALMFVAMGIAGWYLDPRRRR